ncbi:zinc ribbon domain-containing protein [Arenimonas aestuarii]
MEKHNQCPECAGTRVHSHGGISAGGGYAPNYLPGLGTFFSSGKFTVRVCADCGLTRFYASPEARAKLRDSKDWRRG